MQNKSSFIIYTTLWFEASFRRAHISVPPQVFPKRKIATHHTRMRIEPGRHRRDMCVCSLISSSPVTDLLGAYVAQYVVACAQDMRKGRRCMGVTVAPTIVGFSWQMVRRARVRIFEIAFLLMFRKHLIRIEQTWNGSRSIRLPGKSDSLRKWKTFKHLKWK